MEADRVGDRDPGEQQLDLAAVEAADRAAAGLGAHFCIANALRLAPATLVMPFDFLRLPVIAVVGLVLYDEPIGPLMLLGATLIVGGNYLNIRAEARRPEAA